MARLSDIMDSYCQLLYFLLTEAVIGFVSTDLSISEDGGELQFEITLLQGTLRTNVSVNFATDDGSASGE